MLFNHASRILVLPKSDKLRMSQPISFGPFQEFKLSNGFWLQPDCLLRKPCQVTALPSQQIENENADNEETVKVSGFHGLHGSRRNLLVVHGLSAP